MFRLNKTEKPASAETVENNSNHFKRKCVDYCG
jgi:hypothetical protein